MKKVIGIQSLARALSAVAQEAHAVESKADGVLAIVKAAGIRDGKAFNAAVREAYKANGWNMAQGRPKAGNGGSPVPSTVKQYVSLVRAAFRYSLTVGKFASFHALREAVKRARPQASQEPADPKMAGIRLVQANELNGAPFHDLTLLYAGLTGAKRSQLVGAVNKLVELYKPAVPELRLAA